ncbi:MAG: 2-oxoacid:ferredoxin oxidoreductase subunit beta [Candidatus Infernicultor aquiphilus]|uniref:2-oxoacid:ferredoxin oxidoreductase subunit beta n=1 Tax=Candidatus Infernicultor aquiphilus TaxID=1805029 RepID=A0A2M7K9X5_9BACT|nr:MAG: 2-oxoacid:ferredoxin oxidoreductase subunit beta [Candidatus Atribacteria bacterium CG_4_8_14_3_um_filter_34_18]PIY32752.1 MAG: 2-oxoacid:ferredoxin oxidoreductase subunit beta [Candidatus Atribacteria bacterium CG_4_10_14_3_um_filter_34_13]PJB56033.1 MAG: 2-oxoacid:ferredoxin oxidoreductase subunit beta [Candidatus Atribacteria bacterium CG_4_9_14_3_um_filter_33_16]
MKTVIDDYIREEMFPHMWCPGCGNGIVLGAIIRAIDDLKWDRDKIVMISGIGCSSRITGYVDFCSMNTTHGRALPFATGIKMANLDLKVVVVMGDGDCSAIGGNHFIHAARRNIDLTAIIINNMIYGMTGGQYSPLTPTGRFGTTAPYGNIDQAFDLTSLAMAAGASYVARGTVYHVRQSISLMKKALDKKGFSVVEMISDCPISFGKMNKMRTAVEMLKWIKDIAVSKKAWENLSVEERKEKFVIGEFLDIDRPEYNERYNEIIKKAQKMGGNE